MARATAKTKTKTIVKECTLTLTAKEAQTLYIVTQYVGGSPDSRRADVDAIRDALRQAIPELIDEIDWPIYQKFLSDDIRSSGINFKDDKEIK